MNNWAADNTLFYGDNLDILKEYFPNESVDLIYLDPPFNSNRNYNVLFKDESGKDSESQITAFEDTWHWNAQAESTFFKLITDSPERVNMMIGSMRQFIGPNQMMAYLVMMTVRLVELHRVLKVTGSLYLHCDPTASHYLKIILDIIFGPDQFRNEIIWKRTSAHNDTTQGMKRYGRNHDVIFFYTKSDKATWQSQYTNYDDEYVRTTYNNIDPDGRKWKSSDLSGPGGAAKGNPYFEFLGVTRYWRYSKVKMEQLFSEGRIYQARPGTVPRMKHYLDEMLGVSMQDLWVDIAPLSATSAERLGYPTQKPEKLLERIIQASSNPGDIVLDPFCGCGTAIATAQKLGRKWLGIDITYLSIALQKYRLSSMFGNIIFEEVGIPNDTVSANALAQRDRYQFQFWALSLIKAKPLGGQEGSKQGKKGSDRGIDGIITFVDDATNKIKRAIVQVKSGHVKSGDIRDLIGTVQREQAVFGIFITLEDPSKEMLIEATSAGVYLSPGWNKLYPKVQIITINELLHGNSVQLPPTGAITFKQSPKIGSEATQSSFF